MTQDIKTISGISNCGDSTSNGIVYEKYIRRNTNGSFVDVGSTFEVELEFTFQNGSDWVMIRDVEVVSTDLTCTDYNTSYSYLNGEDTSWNMTTYIVDNSFSSGSPVYSNDEDCSDG